LRKEKFIDTEVWECISKEFFAEIWENLIKENSNLIRGLENIVNKEKVHLN
jgi:DNA-binding transcriptional regulator GbsR (MarR family)